MSDPKVVAEVEAQLLHYAPAMERLNNLLLARDPIASGCLKEIACCICDLCAHLGLDYDVTIGTLLLQYTGGAMQVSPEKWVEYTRNIAPQCNANKMRTIEARNAD